MFTNLCVCMTLCTFYILLFTSACGKLPVMNFGLFNMAVVCKVVVCIFKNKNNNNNYINIILVYSYYTFLL